VELGTLLLDEVIESWFHEGAHHHVRPAAAGGLTAIGEFVPRLWSNTGDALSRHQSRRAPRAAH
jgi:hypothetical protein